MAMTFPEFQKSRREVADVSAIVGFDDGRGAVPGFLYADDSCYIERLEGDPRGKFYLLVERSDWISDDLARLENILWAEHYLSEGTEGTAMLSSADGTLDDFVLGFCAARGLTCDGDIFGVAYSGVEALPIGEAYAIAAATAKVWRAELAVAS